MSETVHRETPILNGAQLYYERRGCGAPVLFITGAFGDGGAWQRVNELLSCEYTTVSYDRRANSRSPAPPGWEATTLDEQAGDAAALIEHLDLGSAVIWASSLGGAIGLALVLRRPDLVRLAVLHEPFVPSLLDDPEVVIGPMVAVTAPHLAAGDLRGAAEAMVRLVGGDAVYANLPEDQRERMLGNAATLFGIEFAGLGQFVIDGDLTPSVPVTLAIGGESASFLTASARHLGALLGVDVTTMPGGHVPQATHPEAVAALVRSLAGDK
jgi:pimeloyl-ACP methyl ester carboxylesterase